MALKVATGSYVGNGADNRNITGLGFTPLLVIIHGDNAVNSASGQLGIFGGASVVSFYSADNTTNNTNSIQSVGDGYFQIGTSTEVNANGSTFYYIAIGGDSADIKAGTYTGNGGDDRAITDPGFQPAFVLIKGINNDFPVFRFKDNSGDASYENGLYGVTAANHIQSLSASGFTIGSDNAVNQSGQTFYYVAIREYSGFVKSGSYAGNGADNRDITGLGFQPDAVLLTHTQSGARNGVFRTASHVGDKTSYLANQAADAANIIQGFISDGFTVGSDAKSNSGSYSYYYLAVKNDSGGGGTDVTVTPSIVSATSSILAPTVTAVRNVAVAIITLSLLLQTLPPTVTASQNITVEPSTLQITASIYQPSVVTDGNATVTPSTLHLNLGAIQPTVVLDANVTPITLSLLADVLAPTVTAIQNTTISPAPVSLSAQILPPSISVDTTVSPAAQGLQITIFEPFVTTFADTVILPINIELSGTQQITVELNSYQIEIGLPGTDITPIV